MNLVRPLTIAAALVLGTSGIAVADANPPTVAVYNFNSRGLSAWWDPSFDPGGALSDLLTDRLVKLGSLSVIDRAHLDKVVTEQHISAAGDVTPATESQLGRMLGVKFLFVGRIVQFDKSSGGGIAGVSKMFGGGASSTKTTLSVNVQVIEANTGRVVESLDDEQSSTATSFALAGGAGTGGMGYTSPDFQNSAMGKLMGTVADDIAKKVDPTVLAAAAPSAPAITGRVVAKDGDSYILNVGSSKSVSVGMMFDAVEVKQYIDPDSHKTMSSEIPRGTIQITSVTPDSSVARKVGSGLIKVTQRVHSEQ
jgi:curli biogenesis system outer membrane secretion channel CsgG